MSWQFCVVYVATLAFLASLVWAGALAGKWRK
jgi:uncharacterized MAPEG superfamily protein